MRFLILLCIGMLFAGCVSDKKTEVASNDKLLIYTVFENEQITQYIGAFNKA